MAYGAFVQSTGVDSSTGTGASHAFHSNLTVTNTMVVGVRFNGAPGTVGISDSRGHTFQVVRQQGGTVPVYVWFVGSVAAGSDIVTITTTNAVTMHWFLAEFEGPSSLGVENGGVGSGTAVTSGNFSTVVATALIVGVGASLNARDFTAGASFTEREEIAQRFAVESRVVSSAGSYAGTFTLSSGDTWTAVGVAFYFDPPGGGTLFTVTRSGVVSPIGVCLRLTNKVVSGVVTPSSVLGKFISKAVSGGVVVSGLVDSSYRQYIVVLGSVVSVGGALCIKLTGTGIVQGLVSLFRRRRR